MKINNFIQFCIKTENEAIQNNFHEQTNGPERLSSLHAKLHQEADKIRKWKDQTEIEIRQKVKE